MTPPPDPEPYAPSPLADPRLHHRRARPWLPVLRLKPRHQRQMLEHLLALSEEDRRLRFGYPATDAQVHHYVAGIDLRHDEVLGVFSRRLQLIAWAHLSYCGSPATLAEFGVSVLAHTRGQGLGRRLFEAATLHARLRGVTQLLIHALLENQPMLRIATQAGASVTPDGADDAQALLQLHPDTLRTHATLQLERHLAELDYQAKEQLALLYAWPARWRDLCARLMHRR